MPHFKRELPPNEILKDTTWQSFKNFGEQWSRLVAWTWTGCIAHAGDLEKAKQEQELKTRFIELLQEQAKNTEIYVKCDAPDSALQKAEKFAGDIKKLLIGDNSPIAGIEITLSDVVKKFTGKSLMTTQDDDVEEEHKFDVKNMFTEMFITRVTTDSFVGKVTYANEKGESSPDNKDKYVIELAYPPRPVFSEATITETGLSSWAQGATEGDFYGPPSAYIPWSAS